MGYRHNMPMVRGRLLPYGQFSCQRRFLKSLRGYGQHSCKLLKISHFGVEVFRRGGRTLWTQDLERKALPYSCKLIPELWGNFLPSQAKRINYRN
jgi:hypothetical protein